MFGGPGECAYAVVAQRADEQVYFLALLVHQVAHDGGVGQHLHRSERGKTPPPFDITTCTAWQPPPSSSLSMIGRKRQRLACIKLQMLKMVSLGDISSHSPFASMYSARVTCCSAREEVSESGAAGASAGGKAGKQ